MHVEMRVPLKSDEGYVVRATIKTYSQGWEIQHDIQEYFQLS